MSRTKERRSGAGASTSHGDQSGSPWKLTVAYGMADATYGLRGSRLTARSTERRSLSDGTSSPSRPGWSKAVSVSPCFSVCGSGSPERKLYAPEPLVHFEKAIVSYFTPERHARHRH